MSTIAGGAVDGAVQLSVVQVAAAYTVQQTDELVQVTTGSTNVIVTLPSPTAAANLGLRVIVEKVDTGSGVGIVQGTLNIGTGYRLASQWSQAQFVCDGTRWNLVATVS
jgi:hypothetical protein